MPSGCRAPYAEGVIHHVAYQQQSYATPDDCVRGIRDLVALGWNVIELRGGEHGPFLVVCRKDDYP